MSTKNVTLHDENGNVLLPATKTSRITNAQGTNLDTLLQQAGQVKSISVNGTAQTIDANGNVNLSITQTEVAVGTTTTGAAGSNASVTNGGTSTAPVLNFTIPKGDKGDIGVGIESVRMNGDYTLTITLTNGNTYTTPSIRGPQGDSGITTDAIGTIVLDISTSTVYTANDVAGAQAVQTVMNALSAFVKNVTFNGVTVTPDVNGNVNIGTLTFDNALSPSSENAVQNKVVKAAIDSLSQKLTKCYFLSQETFDSLAVYEEGAFYCICEDNDSNFGVITKLDDMIFTTEDAYESMSPSQIQSGKLYMAFEE